MTTKTKNISKEADSMFSWFVKRVTKQNRNVIIAVVGAPGSGKSYACLRILEKMNEILYPGTIPNIENCARSIHEFMDRLQYVKKGNVLILEEVGVNLSSTTWASKINRIINHVMQTFRTKNLIVLLNLPDLRMLDVNARRLLHGVMTMKGINHQNKTSSICLKVRQHNYELQKDYWKYLRARVNNKEVKISKMTLKKIKPELEEIYEKRRKVFTDRLDNKVRQEVANELAKENRLLQGGNGKEFTLKQWQIYNHYHQGTVTCTGLAKKMGVAQSNISVQFNLMRKKYPRWKQMAGMILKPPE